MIPRQIAFRIWLGYYNKLQKLFQKIPLTKKKVRVKALLDQESPRSYLSQRIKSILDIASIFKENISISTFEKWNSKQSTLEKVCFNLKNETEKKFRTEALSSTFTSLPVKNQLINFAKTRFDYLKDLQLADSGPLMKYIF